MQPVPAWMEFKEKLLKLNRFDPNVLKLENFFIGSAHRCEIDAQGRILIPPPLRDTVAYASRQPARTMKNAIATY